MDVVHFPTKNYYEINGKRKENQLLQFPFVCEVMLESLLLVHGHDERDLRHLKLTFDLVVELLPVAIELHDALRLLFQPELIKLIRQVTCQHDMKKKITFYIKKKPILGTLIQYLL